MEKNNAQRLNYDYENDVFTGVSIPEITVTGNAPSWFGRQGLYPNRLRYNPNKWVTARTKLLDYDDLEKAYTAATAGMFPNYLTAAKQLINGDISSALSTLGMMSENYGDGNTHAMSFPIFGSFKSGIGGFSENWDYTLDPVRAERLRRVKLMQAPTILQVLKQPVINQTPYVLPTPPILPTVAELPVQRPVIKLKEGVKGDYRKTYAKNLAEDKKNGIGKNARRDFLQKVALSSGDGRAANPGRPKENAIRDMYDHIERYPISVLKGLDKVLLKVAKDAEKQGFRPSREEMFKDSRVKAYLKKAYKEISRGLIGQ